MVKKTEHFGQLDLPASTQKTIEYALQLSAKDKTAQDLMFLASPYASLSLPHKKTYNRDLMKLNGEKVESLTHKVTNGRDNLVIEGSPSFGLPYGRYPRLFHLHICSEIKKTKSNVVSLKKSLGDLMDSFDILRKGAGKKNFYEQIQRFINASYRIERKDKVTGTVTTVYPERTIESHTITDEWARRGAKEDAIIVFKQWYADEIIKSSVPYHREAVLGLKGSTIALDLYGWTSLRCYMLEAQNISDIFLSFQQISDQLGSSYSSNNRQFKKDLQAAFRSVSLFSPDQIGRAHV